MMIAEIIHEQNRFTKEVEGKVCELEYLMTDDHIINFHHTYVPESLRGQGLAMELIKEGLDYAVEHNFKIIPSCSAVSRFIERNSVYKEYLR